MRKRIDAETDYNILADIALGLTSKEIAKKYNVSISYVSKVRTGRKKINVYIPEHIEAKNKLLFYKQDINKLLEFFETSPLSLDDGQTATLDGLIIQKLSELKVLLTVRKTLTDKTNSE